PLIGSKKYLFLLGRQDYEHIHTFESWPGLYYPGIGQVRLQPLKQAIAKLLVRDLAPSEVDRSFDFVTFMKYSGRMVLLKVVVVFVGARPEFDLFDGDDSLLSLGFFLFLFLLVLPLAEIDDAAHGRSRLRCDFDEIEAFGPCYFERLLRTLDSQLR